MLMKGIPVAHQVTIIIIIIMSEGVVQPVTSHIDPEGAIVTTGRLAIVRCQSPQHVRFKPLVTIQAAIMFNIVITRI